MFVVRENSLNESDSRAEQLCRQSMARAGFAFGDSPATFHWSQLVNPAGDKKAAIAAYEALLLEEPENKSALEGLAFIYQTLGNVEQASKYRRSLREVEAKAIGLDVQAHPEAVSFLLAKTGEAPQPDRVPSAYVQAHFDQYADGFDSQLCEQLKYQAHLLVEEECNRIVSENGSKDGLSVLDIGCGTGLTGQAIYQLFSIIDGVDLSEKMLGVAAEKNVYSNLKNANYQEYLATCDKSYNVVTASDVLIYEGDLKDTLLFVRKALKNEGHFIFTVEKGYTETYCLRNTGRFQHNHEYIIDLARDCGFKVEISKEVKLRVNDGQAVIGYLFTLRK